MNKEFKRLVTIVLAIAVIPILLLLSDNMTVSDGLRLEIKPMAHRCIIRGHNINPIGLHYHKHIWGCNIQWLT